MGITLVDNNLFPEIDKVMSKYLMPHILFAEHLLYKKLGYVFYIFCIHFVYVFKKSTVFIRNWLIFCINYMFLILCFLYIFKNLIKNVELKTYNLYGILTNSL